MSRKTLSHAIGRTSLALTLAALLLCTTTAPAATWYVKPSTEVPIRAGQGQDFKILAVVPDGMAVELLEEATPWARVRTPGGTEGWMLKRYLSSEPAPARLAASLQTDKARLEGASNEISRKYNELSQAHALDLQQLESCRSERDEARSSYETLRQETADVIAIKNNHAEMTLALQAAEERLATAEGQLQAQKRNTALLWFLAGGLVLLCGWFLGSLSAKNRKRKTTLY